MSSKHRQSKSPRSQMVQQVTYATISLFGAVRVIHQKFGVGFEGQNYFDAVLKLMLPADSTNPTSVQSQQNHEDSKAKKEPKKEVRIIDMDDLDDEDDSNNVRCGPKRIRKRTQALKGRNTSRNRSAGLEQYLINWIQSQLQNSRIVTRSIIRAKAKQLGQSSDFKACERWCDYFLQRNPQLRSAINRRQQEEGVGRISQCSTNRKKDTFFHKHLSNDYAPYNYAISTKTKHPKMLKKQIYYSSSDDIDMDDESGPNFGDSFGADFSGDGETEKQDESKATDQNFKNNGSENVGEGYGYKIEDGQLSEKQNQA